MAGFKLNIFKGLRPRIGASKLELGDAVTAQNLKLGSGDLEPIPDKSTVQAVGALRKSRSIYLFDNAGSPIWLEWDDYVDVVRGPVKDDSIERTYYTGDTTGNGSPKLTTTELADLGNGGPYPEGWLYIGVPAPVLAPTVTPLSLPEDVPADQRIASNFKSDELIVDEVKWTTYPGTGTRNQTWRPEAAATGNIHFDLNKGMALKVTSVINPNRVTIESVSDPGITFRTVNSDKTTPADWEPMDEQGTTQEADFIGWRIPPGMQVNITGHFLNVGDTLVVSAINRSTEFFAALTDDFYEQSWEAAQQVTSAGGDYYWVADARVSPSAVTGDSQWSINGSFYYDVNRAGSTVNELEDRSYVYTYVNSLGEEGPPSDPSTVASVLDGQSVLVSEMSLPPTIGYDITQIRLYRTNSTEAGTEFQFVKEFDVSRTTTDAVKSEDLAEVIATTTWTPPPSDMLGITTMPNGMLVGFKGKQLYFCEPYFPHAYPAEYDQAVDYDIVGLASFGNSVVALTKGWPYIVTGSHPRNANVRPIKVNQACVNKESIATDGDNVYYASPDGIVEIGIGGIRIATESLMDKSDWATYSPSDMVAEFYEGRYYGFYGFDVSVVDDVITAEVSGTITDADESDIINGGRTVILTLTNDIWVAEGTAFNNQRQNIIDGLDATTDQTLGWNNLIRDTALLVGHVVRFSDTQVIITLPVVPGYAISSAEIIQPTVPGTAITAGSAALTTSTYTIQPDAAVATVTLGGNLDGATEANVVSGGGNILMTLTNDTWTATLTDDMKQQIINGLLSTTDEVDGWNDVCRQTMVVGNVVRTSDTLVTITLPAFTDYSITSNESVYAVVPEEALVLQQDVDATSINSLSIAATGVPSALFSGTVQGVLESEIVTGSKTVIITLSNDTWIAQGTGPIGTTAQSQALLDALLATTSQTLGWNNVVIPGLEVATDLVRTSNTVATITLDPEATYSIATNETVGMTIPAAVLTSAQDLIVTNTFGVTAQSPPTAVLTGTIIPTATETEVVDGGKTLIVTLSGDTFKAAGTGKIGSSSDESLLLLGLDGSGGGAGSWDLEVKANLNTGDLTRDSDTQATIVFGAEAGFSISSAETITWTIPTQALVIGDDAIVASPTFQINPDGVVSAAISGTATSSINEQDIIDGGKTIIIDLTNDTWVASGGAFYAIRGNIIAELDSSQAEAGGWDAKVRDVMADTTVVRTSDTRVTITLPATADYAITSNETITVTVPNAALETTSAGEITGSPTFQIAAQTTPTTATLTGTVTSSIDGDDIVTGGKTIILTLSDDTWLDAGASFEGSRAAIIAGLDSAQSEGTGWNAVLRDAGIDVDDVVRTSATVVTITLDAEATYSVLAQETITVTIPAAALSISSIAVATSPTSFTIDPNALPPTTATLTGTTTASIDEDDIIVGGKTMILTLTNDTWLDDGAAFEGSRAAIIAGFDAAASPAFGWNNVLRDAGIDVGDVVRTSATVVTITLDAEATYDISAQETVSCEIPASALTTSDIAVTPSPSSFTIDFTLCSAGTSALTTITDNDPSTARVGAKWDTAGDVYSREGTVSWGTADSTWKGSCPVGSYENRWTKTSGTAPDSSTGTEGQWYAGSASDIMVAYDTGSTKTGSFVFECRRASDQVVIITDPFTLVATIEPGE